MSDPIVEQRHRDVLPVEQGDRDAATLRQALASPDTGDVARLRARVEEKRDCTVCDGDGQKQRRDPPYGLTDCGGCDATGKVYVLGAGLRADITALLDTLEAKSGEREVAFGLCKDCPGTHSLMCCKAPTPGNSAPEPKSDSWPVGEAVSADMNQCETCGRTFTTAPRGYVHKCQCGGKMKPLTQPVTSDAGEMRQALKALPVRTLILNVDTGERGAQSVEMPIELRDRIIAALSPTGAE